jgi:hypothetical protein
MRTARRGLLALALGLFIGWTGGPGLPDPAAAAQGLTAGNQAYKIKVPTSKGHLGDPRARAITGSRAARASNLMAYNGGRVANVPEVYLSFWGPEWASDGAAVDYLNSFFGAVGGSDWLASTTQYCSGQLDSPYTACVGKALQPITNPPGQLKGTWNDPTQVSYSTPATACGFSTGDAGDCDVMLAASRAASHFSPLPQGAVIMVMSPGGRSQPGFASGGWCAYHWAIPMGGPLQPPGTAFGYLPYQPDAGGSCGANSVNSGAQGRFDGFSIIGGHEYAEAITDPYPGTGWMDSAGSENADKCAWFNLGNAPMGGRLFAIQPLWSNATGSCVTSTAPPSVFRSLGGTLTSAPAAASWSHGRLDVFARGTDNGLWHAWSEGGSWAGWEQLGGVLTSEPAAAAWGPNRLDVFARGSDKALWHRWWGGSGWSDWERAEASLKTGPAVASWSSNRLDVFAQGPDDTLWHRWWDGSAWGGWEQLGGVLTSSPAAVAWGPNRIDVFVRGADNAIWHKWWSSEGWSGWASQGGSFAPGAAASSRSAGRLDVFARRTDGSLWRQSWDGSGWTGWSSLGGQWMTSPAAVARGGASGVDVFEVGPGKDLQYASVP